MPELAQWDSFYVIVGGAAGALIGLQFVVLTLIAERPPLRVEEAGAAFSTPTIIHFSVGLLLAALLRAPWRGITMPAALCALIGVGGVIYQVIVARRMRTQKVYKPQFEDWLCHFWLPLLAYAVLAASACSTTSYTREALFGFGGAILLLLFLGIHNTWDAITYHVFVQRQSDDSNRKH